jgi:hypothetical protein
MTWEQGTRRQGADGAGNQERLTLSAEGAASWESPTGGRSESELTPTGPGQCSSISRTSSSWVMLRETVFDAGWREPISRMLAERGRVTAIDLRR